VAAGVLLAASVTVLLPIVTVIGLLVVVDVAVLACWFYFRPGRDSRPGKVARTPIRSLADMLRVAGWLLIGNALLVMVLGVLTELGVTNATTANWGGLADMGFQVSAGRPLAFGARCLVVAAAVWLVGFGLTKATGEKA
jgi:hypothetical protein